MIELGRAMKLDGNLVVLDEKDRIFNRIRFN